MDIEATDLWEHLLHTGFSMDVETATRSGAGDRVLNGGAGRGNRVGDRGEGSIQEQRKDSRKIPKDESQAQGAVDAPLAGGNGASLPRMLRCDDGIDVPTDEGVVAGSGRSSSRSVSKGHVSGSVSESSVPKENDQDEDGDILATGAPRGRQLCIR